MDAQHGQRSSGSGRAGGLQFPISYKGAKDAHVHGR